jgi:predicted metal-dependent RNase
VVTCNAFSAHADQPDLIAYVRESGAQLRGGFLVHGDAGRSSALAEQLKAFGCPVMVPSAGDEVALK